MWVAGRVDVRVSSGILMVFLFFDCEMKYQTAFSCFLRSRRFSLWVARSVCLCFLLGFFSLSDIIIGVHHSF